MNTRRLFSVVCAAVLAVCAYAQDGAPKFKLYGFVRNYFAFDTRESFSGTEDLYYYMPKDVKMVDGADLNAIPSFRFAALTSRLGLDVSGYEFDGYKIGAKIETDFYSGLTAVTGTATLRLRQAYMTLAKGGRSWKIGQAWHPMAADLPDIFSLESGAPFGPFSRTPQVTADFTLAKGVSLTASAIWQMQYTSTGPDGAVANYIKYGCTPELYMGLNFKSGKTLTRVGVDVLSIKPRNYNKAGTARVDDRLTTVNLFAFGQQTFGGLTLKEKATYAEDGSHMNMVGGYGVFGEEKDGSWNYLPTRTFSMWATGIYKSDSRWVPSILLGYVKNFGTSGALALIDCWGKNSYSSLSQMYRIQPEVIYNLGKVSFGLEYMLTSVQYGDTDKKWLRASENLHWVTNHRVQTLVRYTF